ncbi:unnamed protein product [Spirodela intermedia]|uniref:Uncharacterized protein n=1 Tax=Spirodela intermedia TaxID=51605 RepID=A0A7I8JN70_SPIIN|nr:unnamed protein product [Spirodela intermedia]CAA6671596.1 unnamed protein product [Spirodela intermedia]
MASSSGSPRSPVDQIFTVGFPRAVMFFENEADAVVEERKDNRGCKKLPTVSPGTKGTLDGYLVRTPDAKSPPSARQHKNKSRAKKNLKLVSDRNTDFPVEPASPSCSTRPRDIQAEVEDQRWTKPLPEETESTELRRFAANFLSLYCGELPSAVNFEAEQRQNVYKRNGSPSLQGPKIEVCIKKQRMTILDDLSTEVVNVRSRECFSELKESSSRIKPDEAVVSHLRELDIVVPRGSHGEPGTADREAFSGRKKCNNTPTSGLYRGECDTPGSVTVSCNRKTPMSSYRSSIFSPGEEFWAEAIQVADCLFGSGDRLSLQVPNGFDSCKGQFKTEHSESGGHCSKVLEVGLCTMPLEDREHILGEFDGISEARPLKLDASLKLTGKNMEIIACQNVSPLPVKHFDFSHEQHNFDKNKGHEYFDDKMKDAIPPGSEKTAVRYMAGKVKKSDVICRSPERPGDNHTEKEKPKSYSGMRADVPYSFSEESPTTLKAELCKEIESSHPHASDDEKDVFQYPNLPCTMPNVEEEPKSCLVVGGKNNVAGTPSSSMPLKDCVRLNTWLPSEVCSAYMKKGISALYPWQVDCLQVDGVLEKRNLVYCASTSAGKSFVAEILMLRRIISTGKMALLVLPYVSICAEKAEHLESLLEPLGKHVRSFYGNQGGGSLPKDTSVAVCTIEKANSLINRLLEEGRLSEVGIIVIDELHMVGDQHRGYLLELLLTKLRYGSGEGNTESNSEDSTGTNSGKSDISHGLQIVGMSATMPNVAAVADWLQAALYQTEFRPVPLEEYIKVGNNILSKSLEVIRTIPKNDNLGGKDPDHIVKLCDEVVQEGHSVLLFCSSRKGCESTAKHISKFLKVSSVSSHGSAREHDDAASVIEALRRCPAGLDPVLEETIPSGVAYHHAGLTVEEREIVETCYRNGLVRVLTATSTLAAGVNLPARRVIFRQPRIGRDFIDATRYKQMSGRAGRTGIDARGESILICKQEEIKRITSMLNNSCPPLQSCLSEDKNGMTHAILEVVAGGLVQTPNDINCYVRCTLLNSTRPFEAVVKSAQDSLRWLCHNKFLQWDQQSQLYTVTPLGRASFGSSLNPEESLVVLDDLSRAREGFVLASDLHLIYIITPINVDVEPDWELYYERFMELSTLDQSVGNRVGVTEPFLMRISHGAPMHISERSKGIKTLHDKLQTRTAASSSRMPSDDLTLRVAKRFYVALMLSRLVQEVPIADVCEAFKVTRGMVQVLQENAGRFALMVSSFCERLGWHDLGGLVAKFQNRVSFGVRSEIAELTNIPYVKGSRARGLYRAGLRTPLAIAEASIPDIAKALFESSSWSTQEGTTMRRIQLGMAKKIKNGARKIIFDQAEEARVAAFQHLNLLGFANVPSDGSNTRSGSDSIQYKETKIDVVKDSNNINDDPLVNFSANKESREGSFFSDERKTFSVGHVPVQSPNPDQGQFSGEHRIASCHTINFQRKGPINASAVSGAMTEFYFDVHFTKRSELYSLVPFEIFGLAVCWKESPVSQDSGSKNSSDYKTKFLSLADFWKTASYRWERICGIMGRTGLKKFTWELKCQIQALRFPGISILKFGGLHFEHGLENGIKIVDNSHILLPTVVVNDGIDMCLVAWILWPDEESKSGPNLEKMVKRRLTSEAAAAANRDGKWRSQMRRAAHNGCCRRVAQTRALCSVLWNLLVSEDLVGTLIDIENPLVKVLSDMERQGIGVDIEACLQARQILGRKVRELEKEAYRLAGRSFSLYTSADIANILYTHLKLPIPEGAKGKQHPSTDKHILDLLRCQHPIVSVIKEHRTLAKLLNSTLGSICSKAKLSVESQRYILRGHWLQTSTATGRLSMEDRIFRSFFCAIHVVRRAHARVYHAFFYRGASPNHARDFFIPTQVMFEIFLLNSLVLLVADYSQIELRLMAHFSKDSSLIDLLSRPDGDVFTMIAARWTGKLESVITSEEREQTKRLVYGILYGMGANSLAEQLDCRADEAAEKIQSFRNSFPAVCIWLQEAVASCRLKGYVQTIKGRRRFLSKIDSGNNKEKARAQRQAVNSICQGSAADIIKIAMIKIHSVVGEGYGQNSFNDQEQQYSMLKGRCHILLQVHDELVLEVDPCFVREAGLLLQSSMESAVTLHVPLHAKLKVGRTWGSLEPLNVKPES